MTFLNPVAWIGLVAIAAPMLIHLLGRRPARRQKFPTLRFLPGAPHVPVRRGRLHDLLLLLVRAGIFAAVVAALAQPVFLTSARRDTAETTLARVIVVDTSASMDRLTPAGDAAVAAARRVGDTLAAEALFARVVETESPRVALPGALAWVAAHPGRREIVVVSDFERDALEPPDLIRVPPAIGLRFVPVEAATAAPPAPPAGVALALLAPADDSATVARRAAELAGAPPTIHADRPIAVVFPGFAGDAALRAQARPIDAPWMFDVSAAVTAAVNDAVPEAAGIDARADNGRLLLFSPAAADTVVSAVIVVSTLRAAAALTPAGDLTGAARSRSELQSWQREPAAVTADGAPRAATDISDGRWFWLLALALLAIEHLMRRSPAAAPVPVRTENRDVTAA
jgi:hypothetical protein